MNNLAQEILEKCRQYLPLDKRIDVHLPINYKRMVKNTTWTSDIILKVKNGEFNKMHNFDKIKFCIKQKGSNINPLNPLLAGIAVLTEERSIITNQLAVVITYSLGNISRQLRKLIKQARNQIHEKHNGIIIIKAAHPVFIVDISRQLLSLTRYKNIIAIIGVGNIKEAIIIKNISHNEITTDFLKIPFDNFQLQIIE